LFGNPEERSYTVRFVDYDGSELQNSRYKVGETPSYNGTVPAREGDAQYSYTFAGWDPEITAVTGDETYTAVYDQELRTYEVTWLNWDGTVLEADPEVPYGEMPSYDGDEPTREADDAFTYSFAGWTPELTAVTADASYTAEYVAEEIETPASVLRIYGNTRYQTSMKIADELKEALGVDRFDAVILATGAAFADALGGSYLSAVKKAPILLIREKGLNTLRTYIRENVVPGGTVYILGGTGAVPDEWVEGLDSFEIKRLSGNTRYATNLAILRETGIEEGAEILVATGKSFADSLSASSAGKPVLLVNETLYKSQKTFLDSVEEKGCTYTILGGASAVSEELQAELEAYTGKTIGRIAGNTRYSTTVLIAERYFPDASSVLLATAEQYPDGLCAGPLGAVLHSPVILCTDARTKNAAAYCAEREIHDGIVLGGPGVLADDTARTILDLSEDVEIAVK
ncbi:MAG: cell wall-binding repeat-containing protein, partial [Lachnospiraceae bacterium]|nr:cell wall-binding repeat-containing protein [Lachnospiraceae bacterium]